MSGKKHTTKGWDLRLGQRTGAGWRAIMRYLCEVDGSLADGRCGISMELADTISGGYLESLDLEPLGALALKKILGIGWRQGLIEPTSGTMGRDPGNRRVSWSKVWFEVRHEGKIWWDAEKDGAWGNGAVMMPEHAYRLMRRVYRKDGSFVSYTAVSGEDWFDYKLWSALRSAGYLDLGFKVTSDGVEWLRNEIERRRKENTNG